MKKKASKGRPKKAAKMKVNKITVSVTPEQMVVIKAIMRTYKIDLSKAIRFACFNCGE